MADDEANAAATTNNSAGSTHSYWGPICSSASYASRALKIAGGFSYHHASRGIGNLSNIVYDTHAKISSSWIPDDRLTRALTGASLSAASVAIDEAARLVPGGSLVWRAAKAGSSEFSRRYGEKGAEKAEGQVERRLREVEREMRLLRNGDLARVEDVVGIGRREEKKVGEEVTSGFWSPEEVIEAFVKEGFQGHDFLDTILVPNLGAGVRRKEREEEEEEKWNSGDVFGNG